MTKEIVLFLSDTVDREMFMRQASAFFDRWPHLVAAVTVSEAMTEKIMKRKPGKNHVLVTGCPREVVAWYRAGGKSVAWKCNVTDPELWDGLRIRSEDEIRPVLSRAFHLYFEAENGDAEFKNNCE